MGKMNELSMLTEELRKCGETLISISEELAGMFSGYAEEKQPVKKTAAKKGKVEEPSRKRRRKRHSHWKMLEPCVQTNPAVVLRRKSKKS